MLEVCGLNGGSEYLHWRLYEAMIVKKSFQTIKINVLTLFRNSPYFYH